MDKDKIPKLDESMKEKRGKSRQREREKDV